jgi:septal ring factor EnvC (AmiA/AmiB activator)
VIADVGVAYGTNVPLSGIIVTKEFSDKYSYNTVCQLMARVGRVGKSWKGEVYVADTLREAIISEMRSTSKALDIESANLEQFHQDFLAEKSKKNTNLDKLLEMIKTAKRLKEQMETERIREEAEKAKLEAEAKRREEEAKRLEAEKAATSVANDEALAAQRKAARRSGRPNTQLASAITSEPLAPKPSPFSRAPAGTPKRR